MSLTSLVSVFVILSSNFSHAPIPSVKPTISEPVVIFSIPNIQTPKQESFLMEEKVLEPAQEKPLELIKVSEVVEVKKVVKPKIKIKKESVVIKAIERPLDSSQEQIVELIKRYSQEYGLDEVRVLRIAKCESTYNPNATSPSGKYKGLFQWDSSFYGWAEKLNIENPNPFNPEHNTRAATLAMSYGLWSKWSCK